MDRGIKDVDRATGTSSVSDDSDNVYDSDDGVDSAEIDETGEDTGEGNGDRAGDGGDDIMNDRSTRDGGGGEGMNNKHQGGTDPFDASNKGMLLKANNKQMDGTATAEYDSSEDEASASAEDGGASGGTNSILSKAVSSNKAPPQDPRKPQLSEPLTSISSQLEARLNDMIQRLNPRAMRHGSYPQQLAHIRAISQDQQGESPLAPRPIFEPLEIVVGSADNSAPVDGKATFSSQGIRFKERMPVVSHGGPLVGPEDFSSPFMERLDFTSNKGNLNEHSTGMISNLMLKKQGHTDHPDVANQKEIQHSKTKIEKAQSTRSSDDQIPQTNTPATTTTAVSDDFDQMIAALLQDLSEHLRKQRAYHDEQSRTTDIIDKAVIQLSKVTWIQKPAQNNSSEFPEYIIHMENNAPNSQPMGVNQYHDMKTLEAKKDDEGDIGNVGLMGVAADRVLSTHVPATTEKNNATSFSENHDNVNPKSTTQSFQTTTLAKLNVETERHINKNIEGPWDWLKRIEPISPETNYSLTLLIELLSELTSEENNISKELAVFSDTGQKLTKDRGPSGNPHKTTDISDESKTTDISGDKGETDSIRNLNETDSSSEEDYSDESSSNESEEDDDDEDENNPVKANDDKGKDNGNPSEEHAGNDNNAPFDLHSTRPTQPTFHKNEPILRVGINEVTDSKYMKKPAYKEPMNEVKDNGGHDMEKKEILQEDDLDNEQSEESDSDENEASDNEDSETDYEYLNGQNTYQETQLFGPPDPENPSEDYIPQSNNPSLTAYGNHIISKRNIKTDPYLETFTFKSLQKIRQPPMGLSRRKRQADMFWQQFLGFGSSPVRQQKIPASNGPQSHGNAQSLSNQLGQGHLEALLPPQNQNSFQTPLQFPNQQNQIGSSQGQGPLQYPILPFRGYPQYSRYNNYPGFSYPNFGYPGYPGYPGMNHEPGESPAFESGPSADVMEEVLNSLFQQYWENVRNMFTTKRPSTTPENEHEGPITTRMITAAPKTTMLKTTTMAATTKVPVTMASTKPQPLYSTGTSVAPPLIDKTNTSSVNVTSINATETQITDIQTPTGQGSLAISSPSVTLSQALPKSTTDKNPPLPPNFFPRKINTKTSPFPFF